MSVFRKKIAEYLNASNLPGLRKLCFEHKKEYIPKKLYKYCPINDYSVQNIQRNQLWLNNPRQFNDPFDSWLLKAQADEKSKHFIMTLIGRGAEFFQFSEIVQEQALRLAEPQIQASQQKYYDRFNETINSLIRVVCLTENDPSSTIMWGHYGNLHKGICLEYDFSNCDDDCFDMIMPVLYYESPPIIKYNEMTNDDDYLECIVHQSIITKSCEWEYESEWRLTKSLSTPTDSGVPQYAPYLRQIFIGALAEEHKVDYSEVSNLAAKLSVPVSMMKRQTNSFKLIAEPL